MAKNSWYIRYYNRIDFSSLEINIVIQQKRRPRIKRGDKVLILNEGNFSAQGIVTKAPDDNDEFNEGYKYSIDSIIEIKTPNDLKGYAYSLPKVYKHYDNPYKHFNRKYGRISEYEFNVIVTHNYFITRTAFGRLFNSMHFEHQRAFIAYAAESDTIELLNQKKDYVALFKMLSNYINYSIIVPSKLLTESNSILENEFNIKEVVGFQNPIDKEANSVKSQQIFIIKQQADRITNAEKRLTEKDTLSNIQKEIAEYIDEERRNSKYFDDKCLPINFNKYGN
ncbi:MAG: hypothetical protein CVU05_06325 [Bacteroidetes bacterium HGW-Bacteroidetes-21]|nr:MAG: hypothetical protein CVU05_06325 [Bacteroidetes bacterium HGW-Bacteroidetes-21]